MSRDVAQVGCRMGILLARQRDDVLRATGATTCSESRHEADPLAAPRALSLSLDGLFLKAGREAAGAEAVDDRFREHEGVDLVVAVLHARSHAQHRGAA